MREFHRWPMWFSTQRTSTLNTEGDVVSWHFHFMYGLINSDADVPTHLSPKYDHHVQVMIQHKCWPWKVYVQTDTMARRALIRSRHACDITVVSFTVELRPCYWYSWRHIHVKPIAVEWPVYASENWIMIGLVFVSKPSSKPVQSYQQSDRPIVLSRNCCWNYHPLVTAILILLI